MSVGQWQRLAIARACFRDAPLMVLDEPAAALDPRAEVEVYRRFAEMAEDKTVLFVSHRLGMARLADRILFLEDGRIVEEGTTKVCPFTVGPLQVIDHDDDRGSLHESLQ